jgi:hypothetical protein
MEDKITAKNITDLIHPYMGNQRVKDRLNEAMHDMGIQALPMARESQYAELYERFLQAIKEETAP